jgi:hypothetical protein
VVKPRDELVKGWQRTSAFLSNDHWENFGNNVGLRSDSDDWMTDGMNE